MNAITPQVDRSRRSLHVALQVGCFLLVLSCYLLSTGPVCRWSYRIARKIYAPLNPLLHSEMLCLITKKWLSFWGAAPWWPPPGPAASGGAGGSSYAEVHFVNGQAFTIINGVPSNVDVGRLKRLAESGDPVAQMQLGTCLYDGKHGIAKDCAEAYKWIYLASERGRKEAKHLLKEMELFLSSNDLANGKAAAIAFESSRTNPER